jgi:phosphoribosylglycinamide formyltransferase 1
MNIAVLASGSGTNLRALLAAEQNRAIAPAAIALVVCNRPNAGAIAIAQAADKPVAVIDHTHYPDRQAFEAAMLVPLQNHGIEALVLAGFMRILTDEFVARWEGRIINTHPSLLPAFPGAHGVRDALAYGVKVTGCTVHFVDASLDGGPIIAQAAVPVLDDDDETTLHQRILAEEHRLLPKTVKLLADGALQRNGRRVRTTT